MSEQADKDTENPQAEATLAKLLQLAGPRADIPPEADARVYERVLQEWQSTTGQPDPARVYDSVLRTWQQKIAWSRRRRWILPIGVAASAVLAFSLLTQPVPEPTIAVATVSKVVGAAGADEAYVPGMTIFAGQVLETAAGEGLSLLLARSESVRVDENTKIRIDAKDRFSLLSGRVYADTGEFVYRDGGLTITTALGDVRDIGTQFSVAIDAEQLDVAVREGRVDVQQAQDTPVAHVAIAGERLLVGKDGSADTFAIAANAEGWNWVAQLAPAFDMDNKSLLDFLKWVARESGMELIFDNNETRASAMRTDLHGSVSNMSPREALEPILSTTTFHYQIEGNRILIQR